MGGVKVMLVEIEKCSESMRTSGVGFLVNSPTKFLFSVLELGSYFLG